MTTKNYLLAAVLVSVALWTGCAKGLGGTPSVTVSDGNISVAYVTQTVPFTASVTGTSNPAVTWRLSGGACTGSGDPCGTITATGPTTATYTAPATAPAPAAVTVIATSQADPGGKGQLTITVSQVKVSVTPAPVDVGQGLVQQFTAVAVPDNTPQNFTWAVTCAQGGAACGTLVPVANNSGVAVYTAPTTPPTGCTNGNCVQVTATSTIDATGVGTAKVFVQSSRIPAVTYTLRFSGHDNANHEVAIAGSVTFGASGVVTGGVEDVMINGTFTRYTTLSGLYSPSAAADDNTNNAGTLTVSASGGPTYTYTAVLDALGNLRMIESDGNGTGSGSLEKSAAPQFNAAAQKFVFGFTGSDSNGARVGYVGLLPIDGTATATTPGNISGGLADSNDHGTAASACAAPPCTVAGTYRLAGGVWTMQLLLGSQILNFDLYIGSGQTTNPTNPLTLYAISTDPVDATHPALSGRMVFQDPMTTYDKTALNASAVSHLTGVDGTGSNTLVSLVATAGDSNGNISGSFDANNAGTIVAAQSFTCPYTTSTGGRYVVNLLGNGMTCTSGLPFVFYASGANRGFLLDQSSAAVMTGAMDPQKGGGTFAPSELPGTYAVATVSNATSGVIPMAANLLLTSPGNHVYTVGGTQYPGTVAVTGTYTLTLTGTGTIMLTAPAANYVIYATDPSHFEMIDVDASVTNASVMFAQQ